MILLQDILKKYADRVVLNHVSYHFPAQGRIALVGNNGAGKTTLLNILSQLDEADDGKIIRPNQCVLGYLPQEPNPNPQETVLEECLTGAHALFALKQQLDAVLLRMEQEYTDEVYEAYEKLETTFRHQGGYELEANAKGILVGLGFSQQLFDSSPTLLSGGWRMRLELAKLLLNNPDFLILDEPTNHLDLPSLIWLENYLQTFRGTLLLVSHDKDLLNRLATSILHLQKGHLTAYKGNFDAFLAQHELQSSQAQQAVKNLQKQYDHVEKFVDRFRAKASKAGQVSSRLKMMGRLKSLQESYNQEEDTTEISIRLSLKQKSGLQVLSLTKCHIGYDTVLSKNLSLTVRRGQRIAIIGANGIGKSTLLKSIVDLVPLKGGEKEWGHNVQIGYYAQDQLDQLDPNKTALENVLNTNFAFSEQRARSLLGAFLFKGQDVFKPLKVLSGGEKSRVGLSCLLAQEANFLLMDEPTNHLDMLSTEILSEALAEYEGTVLFVSHSRDFINAVATHVFAMTPDGKSQLFLGQLDDYVTLAEKQGFPNILALKG